MKIVTSTRSRRKPIELRGPTVNQNLIASLNDATSNSKRSRPAGSSIRFCEAAPQTSRDPNRTHIQGSDWPQDAVRSSESLARQEKSKTKALRLKHRISIGRAMTRVIELLRVPTELLLVDWSVPHPVRIHCKNLPKKEDNRSWLDALPVGGYYLAGKRTYQPRQHHGASGPTPSRTFFPRSL
jgi:hypothetical protein